MSGRMNSQRKDVGKRREGCGLECKVQGRVVDRKDAIVEKSRVGKEKGVKHKKGRDVFIYLYPVVVLVC